MAGSWSLGGWWAGDRWPKPIHTQSPHSEKELPNIFFTGAMGYKSIKLSTSWRVTLTFIKLTLTGTKWDELFYF